MDHVIEIVYLDTETDEMRRGELVNPYRISDDNGISILTREECGDRPENVTVLTLSAEMELFFAEVEPHNISAYRLVEV